MKVDEVADFLIREGVRPRFFAINTVVADDAVVLYQEGPARWVVFYTERGVRSSLYFIFLNELPLLYQSKQKMTIPSHYPLNGPDTLPK